MTTATPDEFRDLERRYHELLELTAEKRAAYLRAVADENPDMARQLDAMIDAADTTDGVLDETQHLKGSSRVAAVDRGDVVGGYGILALIASGGMGSVFRARQERPRRDVALKVLRAGFTSRSSRRRFELESEILATLRHPGIAQVYDAGVHATADGDVPWFAMELVDGVDITTWVRRNEPTTIEKLQFVANLCDAVQHAHQKGVIHRDLKPSNVLVDAKSQPKILDFGVARPVDDDLRPTLQTDVGQIVGTVAYMSPEQTLGDPRLVDTRTDVYAIGVVLHEMLIGSLPYEVSSRALPEAVETIRQRRPAPLSQFDRSLRGDPETIVGKALEKERDRRYDTAAALAADIRRYLRLEPIEARPPSTIYKLGKFVRRNKVFVGASAAILIGLVVSVIVVSAEKRRADAALEEVQQLSDFRRLEDLESRAAELWPPHPQKLGDLEDWLEDARPLVGRLAEHVATLETLRASAVPWNEDARARHRAAEIARKAELEKRLAFWEDEADGSDDPGRIALAEREVEEIEDELAKVESVLAKRTLWRFATFEDQWRHDQLTQLVATLRRFATDELGTLADVERRVGIAERIRESDERHVGLWQRTIEAIRASPKYGGLVLRQQTGLVPLGPDPRSGLHEFLHWRSHDAEMPVREDGVFRPGPRTGIILVLIPGGTYRIGAQEHDVEAPHHDPQADRNEKPVHTVDLAPYFISKYEMSQGQWSRMTWRNQSGYPNGARTPDGTVITFMHPVENITWRETDEVMRRLGLSIPTEAQWEVAGRAGSEGPWWTGATRDTLAVKVNIADQSARRNGVHWREIDAWPEYDDGHPVHGPVDALAPNPWGLHHVHGNVWEWCRDWLAPYHNPVAPKDGERMQMLRSMDKIIRGGSFHGTARDARVANRNSGSIDGKGEVIGIRPGREIEE